MLLRIQSLYLFLSGSLISLMFAMPVSIHKITETDSEIVLYNDMFSLSDNEHLVRSTGFQPDGIIACAVILLSFVTLFVFKKRNLQIKLARLVFLLLTLLSVLVYVFSDFKIKVLAAGKPYSTTFLLGAYAPFIALLLIYLAVNAIKKDEELVRSADRLR